MAWSWDDVGRALREGLETAATVGATIVGLKNFQDDMDAPLDEALDRMTERVRTMAPDTLEKYESVYLAYARMQVDPDLRTRSAHLYAWMKLNELQRFGRIRGFAAAALPHEL